MTTLPEPAWVQLVDDEQELTVVELDDALVDGAPWVGWPVQLAVALTVEDPAPDGQPYDDEHASLLAWAAALEELLGEDGRLVASITMGGVRELVAYLRTPAAVERWETDPPAALGTHEAQVTLLSDPGWLGLREIAGTLRDDEEPLRAPEE